MGGIGYAIYTEYVFNPDKDLRIVMMQSDYICYIITYKDRVMVEWEY